MFRLSRQAGLPAQGPRRVTALAALERVCAIRAADDSAVHDDRDRAINHSGRARERCGPPSRGWSWQQRAAEPAARLP